MLLETQAAISLDFSSLTTALSSAITPEMILTIMGVVIGATASIFLVKWGGSKIVSGFQRVIKGGKISV